MVSSAANSTGSQPSKTHNVNYGFGGRLTEEFPSQVIVDLTEICNLKCTHCPHEDFTSSDHYNSRQLDPKLNKKLVDEVNMHGAKTTQYIRYTSNGEPLLHPSSHEMIDYAVRNSGVFVTLTTNGTILNEKRVAKLLESGLHLIDISIDAYLEDTYSKIRVNGNLQTTRSNVLRLIDMVKQARSKTKVVVSFIEQPENIDEISSFQSYWQDNGADQVIIRRLHSAGGAVDQLAGIMRNRQAAQKRKPCLYPWERILLSASGNLAFCPSDWSNSSHIMDYRNITIRELWSGKFYKELRNAHLCNDYRDFEYCRNCPDWEQTRWPEEGRSYANMIEDIIK